MCAAINSLPTSSISGGCRIGQDSSSSFVLPVNAPSLLLLLFLLLFLRLLFLFLLLSLFLLLAPSIVPSRARPLRVFARSVLSASPASLSLSLALCSLPSLPSFFLSLSLSLSALCARSQSREHGVDAASARGALRIAATNLRRCRRRRREREHERERAVGGTSGTGSSTNVRVQLVGTRARGRYGSPRCSAAYSRARPRPPFSDVAHAGILFGMPRRDRGCASPIGRFEPEFTAPVPVKSRAAPEQPAGEIFDRIMHNMGVGRTAKLTELHRLCNSVSKDRDAELLEQAITRYVWAPCAHTGSHIRPGHRGPIFGPRRAPLPPLPRPTSCPASCPKPTRPVSAPIPAPPCLLP